MRLATLALHKHTPDIEALDARGWVGARIRYLGINEHDPAIALVARQVVDTARHRVEQFDSRLQRASSSTLFSLTGRPLRESSVDAGMQAKLLDAMGLPLHSWDSRFNRRRAVYDAQLRLAARFEQAKSESVERCVERLTYGVVQQTPRNLYGQLSAHDDSGGGLSNSAYSVQGRLISQSRLSTIDTFAMGNAPLELSLIRQRLLSRPPGYTMR